MAMSRPLKPEDLTQALECPVCHDHYRSPKMLPCGHTMCLSPCLEQIADGQPQLRCPECRTEHNVPGGRVDNFPTNIFAARLFESRKQVERVLGCPICGEVEDRSKCHHCGLLVCDECKQSHSVKFRDQLMELLVSLKEDKTPAAVTSWTEQKSKAEASVKETADLSIKRIKRVADKAHNIITSTTEEQIRTVEDFSKEETKNIKMLSEEVEQNYEDVLKFYDIQQNDLKRKVPSQSKLAKMMSAINAKQQTVTQSSQRLQNIVRDMNVMTDLRPLEKAARSLAQVVVQDPAKQLGASGEVNELGPNVDKLKQTRPESVLTRDVSSVKLCVGSEGSGDANLTRPYGVAVDPDTKDIFIADHANGRIQVFDKYGHPKRRFGSEGNEQEHLNFPVGVALSTEHIIVTDIGKHDVKIYTRDGSFVRIFGREGEGVGEFKRPRGVAVDGVGNFHICDGNNKRVQVFGDNGGYKYQYNPWKSVCDESLYGISINRNGNIAVNSSKCIVVVNKQLQLLSTFPQFSYGVSWIDDDHLIVPDHHNHVLKVYTISGDLVKEFGERGHCVGQLQQPWGVAVDEEGFVYVASEIIHMVQKF